MMDETTKRPKKAVMRSPNYPAFGLAEAIDRAKTIYQIERRNSAPADVLAEHLGYKPKTGPANRALSALRQYGLLEEKNGQYRISDAANVLFHAPEGSSERDAAMEEAAQKPALFKEIMRNYADGLPSDVNLRSWLLTRKNFNPKYVGDFIKSFKETISLAKLAPGGYDGADEERKEGVSVAPETEDRPWTESPTAISPSVQVFNWALSIPRNVRAELRLYGRDLRREDIERIRKHLDLLEEAFSETEDQAEN